MKKFILCLGIILMISACSEILEKAPKSGIINDASFFQTTEEFDIFMFGMYSELCAGVMDWIMTTGFISQDMYGPDQIPKVLSQFLNASNDSYVGGLWNNWYRIVSKSNTLLAKIPDAPISDADKIRLEGEALFFRGFAYSYIARAFGSAPLMLSPYQVDYNLMTCTPEDEIWDQVILDFTGAAAKIPTREAWGADNLGRATKGSAYAYLADAYMYKEDWAGAETASNSLIALGTYSLMSDVRDVFSLAHQNNVESIFEVQFRDVLDGNVTWAGQGEWGSPVSEYTAPRNIGIQWAPSDGWGEMIAPIKLAESFEPGDDRRAKLIRAPGEKYKGELMSDTLLIPLRAEWNRSCFSTKYWYGPPDVTGASYFFRTNIPAMRYAEFLLNYAEILFKAGKTSLAYDQIDLVRNRAKLPDLLPRSTDEATFMAALMKERRAELNFELNYWWHYTRTGTAESFLEDEFGLTWNPAWSKMPIPSFDRAQNPNLCQNPGY